MVTRGLDRRIFIMNSDDGCSRIDGLQDRHEAHKWVDVRLDHGGAQYPIGIRFRDQRVHVIHSCRDLQFSLQYSPRNTPVSLY